MNRTNRSYGEHVLKIQAMKWLRKNCKERVGFISKKTLFRHYTRDYKVSNIESASYQTFVQAILKIYLINKMKWELKHRKIRKQLQKEVVTKE